MACDSNYGYHNLSGANQYSPSSCFGSPLSTMSPNSTVMSSPGNVVPCADYSISHYSYPNASVKSNAPYLIITEQPSEIFRFRYISEMSGTHGCLIGQSGKKKYPTVQLINYSGSAKIRCELVQANQSHQSHPHGLVMWKGGNPFYGPHEKVVGSYDKHTATFKDLSILFMGKKQIVEKLMKEKLCDPNLQRHKEAIEKECKQISNNINLNTACLKFSAYSEKNELICASVFSTNIDNSKSAETAPLKIVNVSRAAASCHGGDTVLMFVEKVNKKNIQIIFFELNEDDERVWECKAVFSELDVHHQYGIAFRIPPYGDVNVDHDVNVYIELHRPSDGAKSERITFVYKAQTHRYKRRRDDNDCQNINYVPTPVSLLRQEKPYTFLNTENVPSLELINKEELINGHFDLNEYLLGVPDWDPRTESSIDFTNVVIDCPRKDTKQDTIKRFFNKISKEFPNNDVLLIKKFLNCMNNWCENPKLETNIEQLYDSIDIIMSNNDSLFHFFVNTKLLKLFNLTLKFLNDHKKPLIIGRSNDNHESPLHTAALKNHEAFVKTLIFNGCNPNKKDISGCTPVHICVKNRSIRTLRELVLYKNCDLNIYDDDGFTPLHHAINNGCIEHVKVLVESGALITNHAYATNKSCLHLCAEKGDLELLKYFLNLKKINVDSITYSGHSALHIAVLSSNSQATEICSNLLSNKADPLKGKNSPWKLAILNKKIKIIDVMKKYLSQEDSTEIDVKEDSEHDFFIYSDDQSDESDYESINGDQNMEQVVDPDIMDKDAINYFDTSGKWRDLAEKFNLTALLPICEQAISPTRILLNDISFDNEMTVSELDELFLKLGWKKGVSMDEK